MKTKSPDQESKKPDNNRTHGQSDTDIMTPSEDGTRTPGAARKVGRLVWRILRIPLYAVFLIIVTGLILLGLEQAAKMAMKRGYAGDAYPHDISKALKDYTKPVTHYDYDFVPGVCLEYNVLKGNRYEYANNAGFREPRDIALEKPDDEYRIFLTGGSTAYGLGSVGESIAITNWYALTYRETISHQMEMILNATCPLPGKTIKVYNTAVWGYAYQHHLGRYMAKLRRYNPDLVVSLDGANEIPIVCNTINDWKYFEEGQFNGILRRIFSYDWPGLSSYLTLWLKNNTFLMTYVWQGRDIFQDFHAEIGSERAAQFATGSGPKEYPESQEERQRILEQNIATVVKMVENYHSLMQNDKIPHIIALQPWYYLTKKPKTEIEQKLAGLTGHAEYYGTPSDKTYEIIVQEIIRSAQQKKYFVVDFSRYFDDVSEWVFTDWCHLTAGGNFLIAKELSNLIKQHIMQKPLTESDTIKQKDPYFWDLAVRGKIVKAPDPVDQFKGPANMLTGYPDQRLYESKPVPMTQEIELVMELQRPHPVSRLRLVWGDESSVPDTWTIEASVDGTAWTEMAKGAKKDIDNFSKWPGWEYYRAEQIPARYVRYRPDQTGSRQIKLRLWSVLR